MGSASVTQEGVSGGGAEVGGGVEVCAYTVLYCGQSGVCVCSNFR